MLSTSWRIAQALSVLVALIVVGLLVMSPEMGLFVTWSLLVPLVPVLLLVAPQVWRNLCPIAVVSQMPMLYGVGRGASLSVRAQRLAPAISGGLFYLIVPLRLTVFNEVGWALAAFVVSILVIATVGGLAITGKGGWCATFCPVLPVERLYGQAPLVNAPHAHCASCSGCIRSWYDLKPERSFTEVLSERQGRRSLLRTPMGLFAAAFPGFILGYFTVEPGLATGPLGVHLWVVGCAIASAGLVAGAQSLSGTTARIAARSAAAVAIVVYYWFTIPAVFENAHAVAALPTPSPVVLWILQGLMMALAAFWLRTGFQNASHMPIRR
jgi:hypothetical protein